MMSSARFIVLSAALCVPLTAQGAEPPDVPDLYALKTPDSPAFVALGVAPTEIQRPTTPSALATSLASAFQSTGGGVTLPQGFAMEAAPYWLVSHPTLSFADYAKSGIESSWYRNATLSFATSGQARPAAGDESEATDMSTTAPGTSVAWGLRTTILHPPLSADQAKCAETISKVLAKSAEDFQDLAVPEATRRAEAAWLGERGPAPPKPGSPPATVAKPQPPAAVPAGANDATRLQAMELTLGKYRLELAAFEAFEAAQKAYDVSVEAFKEHQAFVAKKRSELINGIKAEMLAAFEKDESAKREAAIAPCLKTINSRGSGWSIDAAVASVYAFPETTFKSGDFKRAQAWGTFAYSGGHLSVLALGRFTREKNITATETELKNSFDYGARLIYADNQWGVSLEFLQRTLKDNPRRVSGGFDYRLLDGTWATATFGKDMGVGSNGAVIALLGLQLNTGKQRLKENSAQ